MSNLTVRNSISPTSTCVMLATVLGSASINTYANMYTSEKAYVTPVKDLNKTNQTFSSVVSRSQYKSDEIDGLILKVFEKFEGNSKPLDDEFARILSDNILDLF